MLRTFCLNVFSSLSPCLLLGHLYYSSFRNHTNFNDLYLNIFPWLCSDIHHKRGETEKRQIAVSKQCFLYRVCHKSRILNFDAVLLKIHFTGYLFDTTAKTSPQHTKYNFFLFLQGIRTNSHAILLTCIHNYYIFSWKMDDIHHTHLNLFNQILTLTWSVCFGTTSVSNSSLFFR